jgi:hypothetical protein
MSCNQECNQGRTCDCKLSKINIQSKDTSRGHFYVSLVKSALRVVAGASLIMMGLPEAGWFLIAAEVLGVVEELV